MASIAGLNIFRLTDKVAMDLLKMHDMYNVIAALPRELFFFEDDFLIIFDWAVTRIQPDMRGDIRRKVRELRVHFLNRTRGG
jgi:hypothetical protein